MFLLQLRNCELGSVVLGDVCVGSLGFGTVDCGVTIVGDTGGVGSVSGGCCVIAAYGCC